jgi:hypothetical protein
MSYQNIKTGIINDHNALMRIIALFFVRPAQATAIGCKSRTSPDSGNR